MCLHLQLLNFKRGKSEEVEKKFSWTILSEKLQTEEESQPSPSHASGRPFRSKKEK
jgi:hypothetical protein